MNGDRRPSLAHFGSAAEGHQRPLIGAGARVRRCLLLAQSGPAEMSAIWPLSGAKRTSAAIRSPDVDLSRQGGIAKSHRLRGRSTRQLHGLPDRLKQAALVGAAREAIASAFGFERTAIKPRP
jgi:hypothetical protein